MKSCGFEFFILVVSIVFTVFHLFLPVYAFLPGMKERAIHLGLAMVLIFLGGQKPKNRVFRLLDFLLAGAGAAICLYVLINFNHIIEQYGTAESPLQVFMGLGLVLLILEMARRAVRPALPLIALLFLLYVFFGHLIPGGYGHPKYNLETIASSLFLTTGGIWGELLGVSSNIIAIFVFLGAFIANSGGGIGFMKISVRLAGRYSGGPAKVAAFSSALFGSISGSASANVASTGTFTIPMMKRLGYRPELAAAVEAVASTGGQIMPPIMGAGAFVMAELVQVPYLDVAAAALLPALLYFATVLLGIHFYAGKEHYQGMTAEEIPGWGETMKASLFFFIPFSILAYWLAKSYTPQYAAFWALLGAVLLTVFNIEWRLDFKAVWPKYKTAILSGARQASIIAGICACAQIIVSVIAMTGIGVKFTNSILSVTGNSLFLALVLAGLTSILLGMEVPTTAAYIVSVVVCGPVLADLGVPLLAAHLFIFYLAILSAITPPVCGAIFIAAGMADADWIKTAKVGLKLSFAAFMLPLLFTYSPSLVLIGSPWETVVSVIKGFLAMTMMSAGFIGYLRSELKLPARIILVAGGFILLLPSFWINLAGAMVLLGLWFLGGPAANTDPGTVPDVSDPAGS
ncbi:MAG: TRAP transporter fused permease subunit [Thermodesulfobacteriota bacterium]